MPGRPRKFIAVAGVLTLPSITPGGTPILILT